MKLPNPGMPSAASASTIATPPMRGGDLPQPAQSARSRVCDRSFNRARQDEQPGRADAVTDHLHHHALERQLVPREDAQQHKPKMADAAIGNQPFEIGLGKRQRRAVENSNHRQHHGNSSNSRAAPGNKGTANRSNPYAPVFESNPASNTLPAVGDVV